MKTIFTISKGIFTLKHYVYTDDMGLERNGMEMVNTFNNTHYPVIPPIRVMKDSSKSGIYTGDNTEKFTEKEYMNIFNEEFDRITEKHGVV